MIVVGHSRHCLDGAHVAPCCCGHDMQMIALCRKYQEAVSAGFFLALCSQCDGAEVPFNDEQARDAWASEHLGATAHHVFRFGGARGEERYGYVQKDGATDAVRTPDAPASAEAGTRADGS